MIILLIITIITNLLILYYLNKIVKIINLNDISDNNLKHHKGSIPLVGGSIIIFNIFFLFLLDLYIDSGFFNFFLNKKNTFIFLAILSIFYLLGFYDDKNNLNPIKNFIISIILSTIYIILNKNLLIKNFSLSFYDYKIFLENYAIFFTLFCIIILINALNFYDGINGQSLIFFLLTFFYLLFKTQRIEFYIFLIIILFFILFFNFKNKLFLGDNGIFVLTIILATSLLYEHNVYKNITFADEIFLLLFLPGLDLLRMTFTRLSKGKNPFYGDRNHIHHLLIKRYSLRNTNLILAIMAGLPLFFFYILQFNFFIVISIFLIIYFLIILKIKNDK